MKSSKKPCGCHISHIGSMPSRIAFCDMHENAEETIATLRALLREAGEAILPVKEASKNHEPLPGVHSYSVFFTDEEIARAAEVAAKIEEATK